MIVAGYRGALGVVAVAIFYTNFANYTEQFGIRALDWILVFCLLVGPLVALAILGGRICVPPIAVWGISFGLISIAWFFLSSQSAEAFRELRLRLLTTIFLLLMVFVFSDRKIQRCVRMAIVYAVLLSVALNIYELLNPLTFSDIPGRSAGLYGNANQSGAAMVLGLIAGYGVVPPRWRLPFILATGVGVFVTFSRSAIVGWLLIALLMSVQSDARARNLRNVGLGTALVVAFVVSPWWTALQRALNERGVLTMDVLDRVAFFSGQQVTDTSAAQRGEKVETALTLFAGRPLLGYGTGASFDPPFHTLGSHNMHLSLMVDHGVIGALILPLLLIAVGWGVTRSVAPLFVPLSLFVMGWAFFSHNVLEERYILLTIALVAAMVATARQPKHAAAPLPAHKLAPGRSPAA